MRALLIGLFGLGLAPAPHAQASACPPLPGVERLWEKLETRFVIFGEVHGTNELPALFADAVCHASAARPVTVALEMPGDRQDIFDFFMGSDGSERARNALQYGGVWPLTTDGRGSQAMLALLDRIRLLRAAGRDVRVVGFVSQGTPDGFDQNYRELEMAGHLARAAYARPDALVFALVGALHAGKARVDPLGLSPAAGHLPASQVISLRYAALGGAAWNCRPECRSNPLTASETAARGVRLLPAPRDGFDGVYSPGGRYTASPPVPYPAR